MPSQQRIQWAKLRIFVVVVSAIAIMSVLVFLLSGGTWLKPKTYLTTLIPDATGVAPDADVQLNGVLVGKVEWVHLTHSTVPNRVVEVRLKVEEEFRRYIPDDSLTEIDSANPLGDRFISITMGKSPRPVPPGGELRFKAPSPLMQNIDLAQFDAQLRTIDQIIQDMQAGKGPLGQFVVGDAMYKQFLDGIVQVEEKLREARGTQSQLGQALYTTTMHDNVQTLLQQLDERLARLQASPLLKDTTQYDRIRDQIAQVRKTFADLNAGKGAGGEFVTSEAAYQDWNRKVAGWIRSVDDLRAGEGSMGRMLTSAQTYESLTGTLRQLQTTVKEFRSDPRKFMRLKLF